MTNKTQTRTDLILALRERVYQVALPYSAALDWLETAVGHDLDDVGLAMANARLLLGEQGDGEMPMEIYSEATRCGALMTEEQWDALEEREENALDRMMDLVRGGGA